MTCEATTSATSSPAPADGAQPCGSLESPMTDLFGQALAPVNRSARRVKSVAATMSATYGLRYSTSSASAALELSLASRLPELLATLGSTMWVQTWKAKHTPLRRRILAHTQSGLLTSDSVCTGWPTPKDMDHHTEGDVDYSPSLAKLVLASWPTTRASDADKGVRTIQGALKELERKGLGADLPTLAAAAWPTPTVNSGAQHKDSPTPRQTGGTTLAGAVRTAEPLGATSNGSGAATEQPGQLNPAFSRWLQGYPKAWCEAAIDAWHSMPTKARKPA